MVFIETPVFSRTIRCVMTGEEYRQLQSALVVRPDIGEVIPGSGGLRKLRWKITGRGKRGGARVIYYWAVGPNEIYMLLAYVKAEQEALTREQLELLRKIVKEWSNG
ncbi:MAG: hypothetical protein ACWGSD_09020 [Thermodesulfobacteriota bacterium]